MKRLARLVFCGWVAASLAGCDSVQMVYRRTPPTWPKSGLIRYWVDKTAWFNRSNRENAYKQIHDFCNGPYQITMEDNTYKQEEGKYLINSHSLRRTSDDGGYWYMDFYCLPSSASTHPEK